MSKADVEEMTAYLLRVRRLLGRWPKRLLVHPSADMEDVREAVRLAVQRHGRPK